MERTSTSILLFSSQGIPIYVRRRRPTSVLFLLTRLNTPTIKRASQYLSHCSRSLAPCKVARVMIAMCDRPHTTPSCCGCILFDLLIALRHLCMIELSTESDHSPNDCASTSSRTAQYWTSSCRGWGHIEGWMLYLRIIAPGG